MHFFNKCILSEVKKKHTHIRLKRKMWRASLSVHLAKVNDKTEYIFPVLATLFNLFSTSIIIKWALPGIALKLFCNTVLVPFLHVE